MAIVKDQARVLRVYEHGNTSLVLVFLCRRLGQVRLLAKGARRWAKKGFEHGFDLLAGGELVAYPRPDGQLWIFKEWEERAAPRGSARTLGALRALSYLCEFTEALTRETSGSAGEWPAAEANAPLHDALAEAVEALSRGAAAGAVLLAYTLRALRHAGLLPDLTHCTRCEKALAGPRSRRAARLGPDGLECEPCLKAEALARLPVAAPAAQRFARPVQGGGTSSAAGSVWLTPEALGALEFVRKTGRAVRLSRPAADAAARALVALVHAALERDLRTLPAAAREVARLGPQRTTSTRRRGERGERGEQ